MGTVRNESAELAEKTFLWSSADYNQTIAPAVISIIFLEVKTVKYSKEVTIVIKKQYKKKDLRGVTVI